MAHVGDGLQPRAVDLGKCEHVRWSCGRRIEWHRLRTVFQSCMPSGTGRSTHSVRKRRTCSTVRSHS